MIEERIPDRLTDPTYYPDRAEREAQIERERLILSHLDADLAEAAADGRWVECLLVQVLRELRQR
jgi:hypothetical protein